MAACAVILLKVFPFFPNIKYEHTLLITELFLLDHLSIVSVHVCPCTCPLHVYV